METVSPERFVIPAAPLWSALWTAQWRSSSASSSRRTSEELFDGREARPFHVAHRDPTRKKDKSMT